MIVLQILAAWLLIAFPVGCGIAALTWTAIDRREARRR